VSFDLILTDMRMETPLAGYEVVRAAHQIRPRPAIVILTAFPIPSSDWRASGADALLVKGADILDLPEKLQTLVKQRARIQERVDPDESKSA
jgi:CheY-like chemotaxis protein